MVQLDHKCCFGNVLDGVVDVAKKHVIKFAHYEPVRRAFGGQSRPAGIHFYIGCCRLPGWMPDPGHYPGCSDRRSMVRSHSGYTSYIFDHLLGG